MMIAITYHCSAGCPHCMSDCQPDNSHMTLDTLGSSLQWLKAHDIKEMIMITGGEPLEHPDILEVLKEVNEKFPGFVVLTTNGYHFNDEIMNFLKKKRKFLVQITNDERYYRPYTKEELQYLSPFRVETVGGLYPQGRALENFPNSDWATKAPKCINSRLLVKQGYTDLTKLIKTLMSVGKFCTPVITPEGTIKIGESKLCPAVGNIFSEDSLIIKNIRNSACNGCEIPKNILARNNPVAYDLAFGGKNLG